MRVALRESEAAHGVAWHQVPTWLTLQVLLLLGLEHLWIIVAHVAAVPSAH